MVAKFFRRLSFLMAMSLFGTPSMGIEFQLALTLEKPELVFDDAGFSQNGHYFFTSTNSSQIFVWDIEKGLRLPEISDEYLSNARFLDNQRVFYSTSACVAVRSVEQENPPQLTCLINGDAPVASIVHADISLNSDRIIANTDLYNSRGVLVKDLPSYQLQSTLIIDEKNQQYLTADHQKGRVHTFRLEDGRELMSWQLGSWFSSEKVTGVAPSPFEKNGVFASTRSNKLYYKSTDKRDEFCWEFDRDNVFISDYGSEYVVAHTDSEILLFTDNEIKPARFQPQGAKIHTVKYAIDQNLLFVLQQDGLTVIDGGTGDTVGSVANTVYEPRLLAVDHSGKFFALAAESGFLSVFKVRY